DKHLNEIDVRQAESAAELSSLHYFLLGNKLETLYLPSAIFFVEGKCDKKFLDRVFSQKYPNSKISVIPGNSDGRIKDLFNNFYDAIGDFRHSPYRDRTFVILDSKNSLDTSSLIRKGLKQSNIIVWDNNGIEFVYPPMIMDNIFQTTDSTSKIDFGEDRISLGPISFTKNELVEKVVQKIDSCTKYNMEMCDKVFSALDFDKKSR